MKIALYPTIRSFSLRVRFLKCELFFVRALNKKSGLNDFCNNTLKKKECSTKKLVVIYFNNKLIKLIHQFSHL